MDYFQKELANCEDPIGQNFIKKCDILNLFAYKREDLAETDFCQKILSQQ